MEDNFIKPKSLAEALKEINRKECVVIAGGTDILVEIHQGRKIKERMLDISSLEEIKHIKLIAGNIIIGAGCTHSEIEKNPIVKEYLPMLAQGCSLVGSTTIRNRGTIGGNVVNSSTCADSVPPLLIYDAKVKLQNETGERLIDLKEFFYNKGKINLEKNEIVTEFIVKPLCKNYKWNLVKVGRRKSLAISRITLAIALLEEDGIIKDLRICPGAMLPKHGRLWDTEEKFKNLKISMEIIKKIGENAPEEVISLSGRRWSTEYKEPVLKGLVIRCLEEFINQ